MYRSGLVPIAWLGLVAGPLIIVSGTAVMFTGNEPSDTLHSLQGIATIPEFLWELLLGIYCMIWGFKRDAPILAETPDDDSTRRQLKRRMPSAPSRVALLL